MMKKIVTVIGVLAMLTLSAACGGVENKQEENQPADNEVSAEDNSQPENSQEESKDTDSESKTQTSELTMEALMNHEVSPESDFFFSDDGNGGVVLAKYLGNEEIVVVPEEVDGKPVKSVDGYVFANDCPVKAIRLPDSMTEVRDYAFFGNPNLEFVVLGSDLEIIGEASFMDCEALCEINLPEKVSTIGKAAFSSCTSLKSITIPDSVTTIEVMAFFMAADDFVIIGTPGSAAETYAASEGITFQAK